MVWYRGLRSSVDIVDDFESGDLSGWTGVDSSATVQQSTVFEGTYALEASPGIGIDSDPGDGLANYPTPPSDFKIWFNTGTTGRIYFEFFREDSSNWYGLLFDGGSDIDLRNNGGSNTLGTLTQCPNDGSWNVVIVNWATDGSYTVTIEDSSGTQLDSISGTDTTHTGSGVTFLDIDANGDYFFDYIHEYNGPSS